MSWMISSRYLRCHNLRHASVDGERDHTRETQAVSCQWVGAAVMKRKARAHLKIFEFVKIQCLANDGMWWIASHYFSDSFECSLYVLFNRKEELSGSCLISSELANSYAVNPHEKHISRGLSVSKYLSSGWCYTQYSLCDGVSWYMRHRDLKAV